MDKPAPIQEDLHELKKAFQDNKELGQLLDSPRLSVAKKKELLADIIQRSESAHFEYTVRIA